MNPAAPNKYPLIVPPAFRLHLFYCIRIMDFQPKIQRAVCGYKKK